MVQMGRVYNQYQFLGWGEILFRVDSSLTSNADNGGMNERVDIKFVRIKKFCSRHQTSTAHEPFFSGKKMGKVEQI